MWARLAGEVGGGSDASPAAANARERVRTVRGERWRCARRGSLTLAACVYVRPRVPTGVLPCAGMLEGRVCARPGLLLLRPA